MQASNLGNRIARACLAIGLLASTSVAALAQDNTAPAQPPAATEAAPAAPALDPATVVATVDGAEITEADVKLAETELDQQFAQLTPEQKRAAALSAIIEIRVMSNKAKASGLDNDPAFKRRIEFLNQRALHAELIDKEVAPQINDEAVRARYDKEMAAATPVNEVKAAHILVKTKEEAEAIIKELDGGADFAAIAKEKSTDPGSGAAGGDLGYFSAGQMVPEFEKAAFALNPGEYTKTPVESQFGFHIIKLEDKRAKQPPAFDAVKDQIRQVVFRDKYFETVKTLRDAAKVEITDPALKAGVEALEKTEDPAQ
jgi:peptidyl-prolyl cis-trans isomerase C